jgi:hypothetical protein
MVWCDEALSALCVADPLLRPEPACVLVAPVSALLVADVAVAIATPTPRATANPPTRPTYLVHPMTRPFAVELPLRLDTPNLGTEAELTIVSIDGPATLV